MNAKKYIITITFIVWLVFFAVFSLVLKDNEFSLSERRPLEQFESFSEKQETAEKRGKDYQLTEYFSWLETYLLEQFPSRDSFRTVSAAARFYFLNQSDYNGYYLAQGSACSMDPDLDENAITLAAASVNNLYNKFFALSDSDAYYCIVPDKNYFYAEKNGYLHYDYDRLIEMFSDSVDKNISYIDIFPLLEGNDYYITDPHWDQSDILPVAQHILSEMGCEELSTEYEQVVLKDFKGTYSGQFSLDLPDEDLILLTNPVIESCTVNDYEKNTVTKVYKLSDYKNNDPYDVFLGGAKALLKISNPSQSNGKQLVVFRDSFGSSLTPLFINNYSEIIVADTRYIAPSLIPSFVEISSDCDVLFIYSTSILNSKGVFRQ